MATIPRSNAGDVGLNAIPGNRLSPSSEPEAFGSERAKQIGAIADVAENVADFATKKFVEERDKAAAELAYSKLQEADRKAGSLFEELQRRADDFISDSPKETATFSSANDADIDSVYGEVENSITDRRAREMFAEKSFELKLSRSRKGAEFENQKWDALRLGKAVDAASGFAASAVSSYADPEGFNLYAERVRDSAENIDRLKGALPDEVGSATRKVMSSLYESAAAKAIDAGNASRAKEILATGRDQGWVSKESGDIDKAADELQWLGEATVLSRQAGSEEGALAALRKQKLPSAEEATKAKAIKQQFAEQRRMQSQREDDANRAANLYFETEGKHPPIEIWRQMSTAGRKSLSEWMGKVARGDTTADPEVTTDLQAELTKAMIDGRKFPHRVEEYRAELGSKYAAFYKAVSNWNAKVEKGSTSESDVVKKYTVGLGKEELAKFNAAYHEEVAQFEQVNKRLASNEDIEKIAMRLRNHAAYNVAWSPFDGRKPLYELTQTERNLLTLPSSKYKIEIPREARERIGREYEPDTEEKLLDYYLSGK